MIQLESKSPRELEYKLRERIGVAECVQEPELRLEYHGRQIPLTAIGLEILSELESRRAYEELIRPGPPYRSGNLDNLNGNFTDSYGREQAERELIRPGLLEVDPQGESEEVYRLSTMAQKGKYVAVVRDERVNF